uniref:Uncharacterized protein n=1 Tax=Nelumbo nucifera TaxID=4432 RepID=A0A822YFJ9_NELNU|nr:TPA_asm: hypothetical protein HUJ06_010118 [Nelumbo nucifera]
MFGLKEKGRERKENVGKLYKVTFWCCLIHGYEERKPYQSLFEYDDFFI